MIKYLYLLLLLVLGANISCKKGGSLNNPLLEQYFATNVLNRNFIVSLALDSSADLTSSYSGETFILLETDSYHGDLQATKNGTVYTGSWSCNDDYSKLTITLPNPPSEFSFLTREWRFTSKNLPTMKLAPWGSTAPIALNMYRQ